METNIKDRTINYIKNEYIPFKTLVILSLVFLVVTHLPGDTVQEKWRKWAHHVIIAGDRNPSIGAQNTNIVRHFSRWRRRVHNYKLLVEVREMEGKLLEDRLLRSHLDILL